MAGIFMQKLPTRDRLDVQFNLLNLYDLEHSNNKQNLEGYKDIFDKQWKGTAF